MSVGVQRKDSLHIILLRPSASFDSLLKTLFITNLKIHIDEESDESDDDELDRALLDVIEARDKREDEAVQNALAAEPSLRYLFFHTQFTCVKKQGNEASEFLVS